MPHRIDVNAASGPELSQVIGIDSELADRIIEERARNGGFHSMSQLAEIDGGDETILERMRERLIVSAEPESPSLR